jgi:16S rRNA (adenine1518-N6/adenine1519-N6)-dimethyltransferase
MEKLPTLQEVVQTYDLLSNKHYSKSHGQNFLFDMNITRKICSIVKNIENNIVLEVGPGPGGLSRAILERGPQKLYGIEIDRKCVAAQEILQNQYSHYDVIQSDALKINIRDIKSSHPNEKLMIIANLPYNVGTELLVNWLHHADVIDTMTLMFQKEVADRIVALPNTKDYGRLSILTQYIAMPHRFIDLPPSAFTPAPKVSSTVVHIIPKKLSDDEKTLIPYLEKVTAHAFNQRRKMLRGSLSTLFSKEEMEVSPIDFTKRAENLTLNEFIDLAKNLKEKK